MSLFVTARRQVKEFLTVDHDHSRFPKSLITGYGKYLGWVWDCLILLRAISLFCTPSLQQSIPKLYRSRSIDSCCFLTFRHSFYKSNGSASDTHDKIHQSLSGHHCQGWGSPSLSGWTYFCRNILHWNSIPTASDILATFTDPPCAWT